MDTKITKKRLNDHLSYDWVKYVALIVATIFLFWLLYDMGGRRATTAQTFDFFIINGSSSDQAETTMREDLLRLMRADDVVYDQKGNRVLYRDEALISSFSNFESYSKDSNISNVANTRLMAGEGDVIVADHATFVNFIQSWFLSIDQLIEDTEEAYRQNWERVKDYPTDYGEVSVDGNGKTVVSDRERALMVRERKFWEEIGVSLGRLQEEVAITELDFRQLREQGYRFEQEEWSEGITMKRYQRYGFYAARLNAEGMKKWQEYSEEMTQKAEAAGITAENEDNEEFVKKYRELRDEFNAKMRALSEDPAMTTDEGGYRFWGLDVRRLNLEKVRNEWFSTQNADYKKEYGEEPNNLYFALGICSNGPKNDTAYYELVKVLDYVLTTFGQ